MTLFCCNNFHTLNKNNFYVTILLNLLQHSLQYYERKITWFFLHFSRATRSVLNARDTYGIVLSFGRCSFLFKAVWCHEWHVSEGAVARDTRRMPLRLDRLQWCSIGGCIGDDPANRTDAMHRRKKLEVICSRSFLSDVTSRVSHLLNETGEISCSDTHPVERDTVLFWSKLLPWKCSINSWSFLNTFC